MIDKEHAQIAQFAEDGSRQVISGGSVFMIDASRGFIKDGNKNRLREQDIHKIIDTFTKQEEIAHYSRMVHLSEIAAQDYNLNLPRYIDSGEVEDLQDLAAHLYGGIPAHDMDALEAYWQVLGRLKNELFAEHDGRFIAKIESSQIKAHILAHPDYAAFKAEHLAKFAAWHTQNDLAAIQPSSRPSELIQQWSESLLGAFKPSSLIEEYDFYQILMDYWAETLQDDVYLIAQDGWPAVKDLAEITKESDEAANLTVVFEETETDKKSKAKTKRISKKYRSEVIAPELIAHRYFSDDLAKLEEKQSELERLSQELENHLEEHSGEESVLNDVLDAKGKLSAKLLKTALEENDIEEGERAILQTAQTLMTQEKTAKDAVKTLSEALNLAIFKQFGQLSEEEIKQLVVKDKWLATLQSRIENHLENAIQQLISRLNTLEDRYRSPMAELAQEVEIWQRKVDAHLRNMGFGG